MITTTTAQLRDLLDMVENWEPGPGSTLTEAWTALQAARQFANLADDLIKEAVLDVRAIPANGKKIIPDDDQHEADRVVTEKPTTAADRADARWSWAAIGTSLGISAQAAQQRYGRSDPARPAR